MASQPPRLVCDIGGTYARFAWAQGGRPGAIARLEVADHDTFADALAAALDELGHADAPFDLKIAAAGRVRDGGVKLTNADWDIAEASLRQRNDVAKIGIVNDFAAIALALPHLRDEDIEHLGENKTADPPLPWLVIGPGTGLGMALSVPDGRGGRLALATEGGHAPLAVPDAALQARIAAHFGDAPRASEFLVSGPGLARLYHMLSGERADPAAIVAAAASEKHALTAVQMFINLLGTAANNAVLVTGAFGGIYLAGGVVRSVARAGLFDAALFSASFAGGGPHAAGLKRLHAALIVHDNPALLGLAAQAD